MDTIRDMTRTLRMDPTVELRLINLVWMEAPNGQAYSPLEAPQGRRCLTRIQAAHLRAISLGSTESLTALRNFPTDTLHQTRSRMGSTLPNRLMIE